MNTFRPKFFSPITALLLALVFFASVVMAAEDHDHDEELEHDEHEERVSVINETQLALSGISSEVAGARTLHFTDPLFGVVAVPDEGVFRIRAPYSGIVKQVNVSIGERVAEGQTLLTIENTSTLQPYTIKSPTAGEVTARMVNRGDSTDAGVLLEIMDLTSVWVDLSAFAETIEKLSVGLAVTIHDMHQHEEIDAQINYISPVMTGGHIAMARAVISNIDGHWRPGMHITAQLHTSSRDIPLAVRNNAVQTMDGESVVFVREGTRFEAQVVELGDTDGEFIEVLSGINPGVEYVTNNSFVLKADMLKDGVSHEH